MSVEKDIRFELLARLCPNSTGKEGREGGRGREREGWCVCAPTTRTVGGRCTVCVYASCVYLNHPGLEAMSQLNDHSSSCFHKAPLLFLTISSCG